MGKGEREKVMGDQDIGKTGIGISGKRQREGISGDRDIG